MPGVKGWDMGSSLDLQSATGMSFSIFRAFPAAVCLAAYNILFNISSNTIFPLTCAVWPSPMKSLPPTLSWTQNMGG